MTNSNYIQRLPETSVAAPQFELFDNGVSLGLVTMTGPTTWQKQVEGLAVGPHAFTAKHQSGSIVSNPWVVAVAPSIIPTIISVKDGRNVEIPDGGETVDTVVDLFGKAAAGQRVEISNRGGVVSTVQANNDGDWSFTLARLEMGKENNIRARGLYGDQPESPQRSFTVYRLAAGFENFQGQPPRNFEVGVPVVFLSGLSAKLLVNDAINGWSTGLISHGGSVRVISVIGHSRIEFKLVGVCRKLTVNVSALHNYNSHVDYIGTDGAVFDTRALPFANPGPLAMEYQSPDRLIAGL